MTFKRRKREESKCGGVKKREGRRDPEGFSKRRERRRRGREKREPEGYRKGGEKRKGEEMT